MSRPGTDSSGVTPARVEILDERLDLDGDGQIRAFPQGSSTSSAFTAVASVFTDAGPPGDHEGDRGG